MDTFLLVKYSLNNAMQFQVPTHSLEVDKGSDKIVNIKSSTCDFGIIAQASGKESNRALLLGYSKYESR